MASDTITVVTAAVPVVVATPVSSVGSPLNLALNLAYLGANYYAYAARGVALTQSLTGGIGTPGLASGARRASFADPLIAACAAELADDKLEHVQGLRAQLGTSSAAQPGIDLSTGARSAFSLVAQGAGIVAAGAPFDPYVSDRNFLLGAFLVENAVAAAYRTLLVANVDATTTALLGRQLSDAIYHGGLVRALLADKAAVDATIDPALTNVSSLLAALDGSDVGDQTLAGASGDSSNILDAGGRPIPFTRASGQVLKTLYLSSGGVGGFLPAGANGIG